MKIEIITPPPLGCGVGSEKIGFFCKNGEKIGCFCKNPARNWVVLIRFQTAIRWFCKANPQNFAPAAGSQINYQSRHISSNNPPVICQSGRPQAEKCWVFPGDVLRAAFDGSYYRENGLFASRLVNIHQCGFCERHFTLPTIEKMMYLYPEAI